MIEAKAEVPEHAVTNAVMAALDKWWDPYAWGVIFPETEIRVEVFHAIRRSLAVVLAAAEQRAETAEDELRVRGEYMGPI